MYLVDPVIESGHTSENSRLLHSVTAQTRNEAGNTMHLPDAGRVLTVQGTARVPLRDDNKKMTCSRQTKVCTNIFLYNNSVFEFAQHSKTIFSDAFCSLNGLANRQVIYFTRVSHCQRSKTQIYSGAKQYADLFFLWFALKWYSLEELKQKVTGNIVSRM